MYLGGGLWILRWTLVVGVLLVYEYIILIGTRGIWNRRELCKFSSSKIADQIIKTTVAE